MIQIPLSQSGPADQFAAAVQQHIDACTAQMLGKPGVPARFVALPYQIIDDTPRTPEQQAQIDLLRETVNG